MAWVNLNDVYVNKTGGTIAGDLAVNGSLIINDGKGSDTTYNVANEITTLRDSVSQYTILVNDGDNKYCAYRKSGALVTVVCNGLSVTANTSKKLGTLPEGFRPKNDVIGFGYVRGVNSIGQINISSNGVVSVWCNITNNGYFAGSVTFPLP